MWNEMIITISGKSGCGNSTVSRLLAEKLNLRLINYTFHDMAREMDMDFKHLCMLSEKDPQYDRYLDNRQVELAGEGQCVLGSRLAIWLLEKADLKVYLKGSIEVRARRIARRENLDEDVSLQENRERDKRDRDRFLRLYGIDIDQYEFAGLIIDTEEIGPELIVEKIISYLG
jgi:CMP/dCMP kinase